MYFAVIHRLFFGSFRIDEKEVCNGGSNNC
jgi:hypothetical protein